MKAEELQRLLEKVYCGYGHTLPIELGDELFAAINQQVAAPKWVKASERLPKEGEYFAARYSDNYWEGVYRNGSIYLDPNTSIQQKPTNLSEIEWLDEPGQQAPEPVEDGCDLFSDGLGFIGEHCDCPPDYCKKIAERQNHD
jgi:hypothetical protein